jgi:RNA polymerase sigma-70 factor (ECF subfamily)
LGSIETLGGLRGAGSDPAEARLPEAASIAGWDAHAREAAIASLPAPLREFLVPRDRFGLSYRQIAAVTGAPVDVAMSGLARARHALIAASAAVGTGARHDAAPRLA